MSPFRIAVVGLGKIASDKHRPAIESEPRFTLAASVDPSRRNAGAEPHFSSLSDLLASGMAIDAVSICTPPQVRHALAAQALRAGLHVMLEKPPAASLAEAQHLGELAREHGVCLFASWHSRFAAGVEAARLWLADRSVTDVQIVWREDVRRWHPGQAWIWKSGGLGVFDPAINALSIATHILPRPVFVSGADLFFPGNCEAPIAARVALCDADGPRGEMDLDFLQTGPQTWDMRVTTPDGDCLLSMGGAILKLPGHEAIGVDAEYPALYARFAELIANGASDLDLAPFRLVADAFLLGRRHEVEPFIE